MILDIFCWTDSFKLLQTNDCDLQSIRLLDKKRKKQIGRIKKILKKTNIKNPLSGEPIRLTKVDGYLQSYYRQFK